MTTLTMRYLRGHFIAIGPGRISVACAPRWKTAHLLRAALVEFARHYNETWLVARHGNRTPAQVRAAQSWPI
jgi:hypothetical protein